MCRRQASQFPPAFPICKFTRRRCKLDSALAVTELFFRAASQDKGQGAVDDRGFRIEADGLTPVLDRVVVVFFLEIGGAAHTVTDARILRIELNRLPEVHDRLVEFLFPVPSPASAAESLTISVTEANGLVEAHHHLI